MSPWPAARAAPANAPRTKDEQQIAEVDDAVARTRGSFIDRSPSRGRATRVASAEDHEVVSVVHDARQKCFVPPGAAAAIQTFGQLVHWHPHVHALVTDGAYTADGVFVPLPAIDDEPFARLFRISTEAASSTLAIFANELAGWYTDTATWPKKRSPSVFKSWFAVSVQSVVLDVAGGPIFRDED